MGIYKRNSISNTVWSLGMELPKALTTLHYIASWINCMTYGSYDQEDRRDDFCALFNLPKNWKPDKLKLSFKKFISSLFSVVGMLRKVRLGSFGLRFRTIFNKRPKPSKKNILLIFSSNTPLLYVTVVDERYICRYFCTSHALNQHVYWRWILNKDLTLHEFFFFYGKTKWIGLGI